MLLDDALGVRRRDFPVPRAFRIHHADGAGGADAQAVALRAVERTIRASQVQLFQPLLQVRPGLLTLVPIDAVRSEADEEVSRQFPYTKRCGRLRRRLILPLTHADPHHNSVAPRLLQRSSASERRSHGQP